MSETSFSEPMANDSATISSRGVRLTSSVFVSLLLFDNRVGGRRIRKLLSDRVIRSLEEFYELSPADILSRIAEYSGEPPQALRAMAECILDPSLRTEAIRIAERSIERGIRAVNRTDPDYPRSLGQLEGMPLVLYYIGDLSILSQHSIPTVGVVGTRQPTSYGMKVAEEISSELSARGIGIVSGLARGIDTTAHQSCLRQNGKTIAVMAGGLDDVYPPENRDLFRQITGSGIVLSEMPPGQPAIRKYFPARNRILSGLSDVVAVIEAGEFSGTLHTASFAAAQGKDVFSVPAGIYSEHSRGNLQLLRDGAQILLSSEDILARLAGVVYYREIDELRERDETERIQKLLAQSPDKLTERELRLLILQEISLSPRSMDELNKRIPVSFLRLAEVLSSMEIEGRITVSGERYTLTFSGT